MRSSAQKLKKKKPRKGKRSVERKRAADKWDLDIVSLIISLRCNETFRIARTLRATGYSRSRRAGFVCDFGRKPADYNHAPACRAPRFATYNRDTRDNWDPFFLSWLTLRIFYFFFSLSLSLSLLPLFHFVAFYIFLIDGRKGFFKNSTFELMNLDEVQFVLFSGKNWLGLWRAYRSEASSWLGVNKIYGISELHSILYLAPFPCRGSRLSRWYLVSIFVDRGICWRDRVWIMADLFYCARWFSVDP